MSAPLLYTMFKAKTKFPLHSAVRLKREDVVFLFLIEFDQEVNIIKYNLGGQHYKIKFRRST
jgi:hypothetical protein